MATTSDTSALDLPAVLKKHVAWRKGEVDGERADLSGADLSYTDLSGADLSRADLSEANLSEADLSRANLSEADLSRCILCDTKWQHTLISYRGKSVYIDFTEVPNP